MMLTVYWFTDKYSRQLAIASLLVCLLSGAVLPLMAQQRPVGHYLSLSLGGGEANTLVSSPRYENLKNLGGADGQFDFRYEVRSRVVFFNFGLNAQYTYTGQNCSEFIDSLPTVDHTGEQYIHRYVYNDYTERQHSLLIGVPLQLGFYMGGKAYIAFGVKAQFPILHNYETRTLLHTDGLYPASYYWRDPLANNPSYGFYPEDELSGKSGTYKAGSSFTVTPTFEVGWFHYLTRNKKVCLRLGVYAEYACPLAQNRKLELTDYSKVNQQYKNAPATFSKEDLWTNLKLNSVLDNPHLKRDWSRMSVGVKATFLFRLKKKHVCVTCDDDSGIDYYPPRNSGGTTMLHDPFRK